MIAARVHSKSAADIGDPSLHTAASDKVYVTRIAASKGASVVGAVPSVVGAAPSVVGAAASVVGAAASVVGAGASVVGASAVVSVASPSVVGVSAESSSSPPQAATSNEAAVAKARSLALLRFFTSFLLK